MLFYKYKYIIGVFSLVFSGSIFAEITCKDEIVVNSSNQKYQKKFLCVKSLEYKDFLKDEPQNECNVTASATFLKQAGGTLSDETSKGNLFKISTQKNTKIAKTCSSPRVFETGRAASIKNTNDYYNGAMPLVGYIEYEANWSSNAGPALSKGLWPGLWLNGVVNNWPANGEIDVMENVVGQSFYSTTFVMKETNDKGKDLPIYGAHVTPASSSIGNKVVGMLSNPKLFYKFGLIWSCQPGYLSCNFYPTFGDADNRISWKNEAPTVSNFGVGIHIMPLDPSCETLTAYTSDLPGFNHPYKKGGQEICDSSSSINTGMKNGFRIVVTEHVKQDDVDNSFDRSAWGKVPEATQMGTLTIKSIKLYSGE